MPDLSDTGLDLRISGLFQEVLRRTHLCDAATLPVVLAEEARAIGVRELVLYVVDHEQKLLVPVPGPGAEGREPLSVNGSVAGRAFAGSDIIVAESYGAGGPRVWLPLLDGTERLGAMELTFAVGQEPPGPALLATCERYSHLIAMLVATKGLYSDFFELLRRRRPMTMASELLLGLVPPLVLAGDDFVLAALLEPCYDIGGDAFDYSLDDRVLHFAVFDAMGHGLAGAGVAAFALSAYRHGRRLGQRLDETYAAIDTAVFEQFPASRFVTALIAELDLASGRLRWISAGHPPPLLIRGGRFIKPLELAPSPPLGMQLATAPPAEGEEALEPGDMVLLYTDGLTEARRPGGGLFTVERLGEFIERQAAGGRPAPETLRGLRDAIIERQEGALRDDASALLVEWRRGTERTLLPETA